MEEDAQRDGEAPGLRWRRAADVLAARWRPRNWAAAPGAPRFARPAAPMASDAQRERVRAVRGQPPAPPHDLGARPFPAADDSGAAPTGRAATAPSGPAPPTPRSAEVEAPHGGQKASVATLAPGLQQHLERFLNLRLPRIEIRTTAQADRLTRRIGADAATADNTIFFRHGAYRPETPAGMALLAHEATHIAWQHGARAPSPLQEEPAALENERRLLAHRDALPMVPAPAAPGAAPLAPAAGATAPAPPFVRAASIDRALAEPDRAPKAAAGALSDTDIRALKADLYRMLLDKLRSEFERGA